MPRRNKNATTRHPKPKRKSKQIRTKSAKRPGKARRSSADNKAYEETARREVERLGTLAKTLGAYALNAAFGSQLQDFEIENLKSLAKSAGCTVSEEIRSYSVTRGVIREIFEERKKQMELLSYTPEHDNANPERLHQEVINRVSQQATVHARADLVEAAALIVAEIERIDRLHPKPMIDDPLPPEDVADQLVSDPS